MSRANAQSLRPDGTYEIQAGSEILPIQFWPQSIAEGKWRRAKIALAAAGGMEASGEIEFADGAVKFYRKVTEAEGSVAIEDRWDGSVENALLISLIEFTPEQAAEITIRCEDINRPLEGGVKRLLRASEFVLESKSWGHALRFEFSSPVRVDVRSNPGGSGGISLRILYNDPTLPLESGQLTTTIGKTNP